MAKKNTSVLDLEKLLGKTRASGKTVVRDRIYLIGVELEGGWQKVPEGVALIRDGSINIPQDPTRTVMPSREEVRARMGREFYQVMEVNGAFLVVDTRTGERVGDWYRDFAEGATGRNARRDGLQLGELVSDPIERKKLQPWMTKFYPSKVNHTCGLHVHQSFRSAMDYQRLMVPEYQTTMLEYLRRWAVEQNVFNSEHHIWHRLSGKNEYCKAEFFPDEQAMRDRKVYDHHGTGNRYTAINYCYGQHKTIEVRVLPMFESAEVATSAVNRVLDITNACLVALAEREAKLEAAITVRGDDTYRDHRQETIY